MVLPRPRLLVRVLVVATVSGAALIGCALVAGVDFDAAHMSSAVEGEGGVGKDGSGSSSGTASGSSGVVVHPGPDGACTPSSLVPCGDACVDLKTSLENCGGCNRPCDATNADAKCVDGKCQVTCKAGFTDCTNTPAQHCAATPKWFLDQDNDGWGTADFVESCTQPAGRASQTGDCLDTDPTVHPDAGSSTVPYLGAAGFSYDYDCSGAETEDDAGIPHFSVCSGDCTDSAIDPNPALRTGTGLDEFCGSSLIRTCHLGIAGLCKSNLLSDGGIHIACR